MASVLILHIPIGSTSIHRYPTRYKQRLLEEEITILINVNQVQNAQIKQMLVNLGQYYAHVAKYAKQQMDRSDIVPIKFEWRPEEETCQIQGKILFVYGLIASKLDFMKWIHEVIDAIMNVQIPTHKRLSEDQYYDCVWRTPCIQPLSEPCPICLESIIPYQMMSIPKCFHRFHDECLKEWAIKKCVEPNCPMCRTHLL